MKTLGHLQILNNNNDNNINNNNNNNNNGNKKEDNWNRKLSKFIQNNWVKLNSVYVASTNIGRNAVTWAWWDM